MQILKDALVSALDAALTSLAARRGEEIARSIRPVLFANLDRGRVGSFIEEDIQRIRDYVEKVADNYERLHLFMASIQRERTTQAWEPLFEQLVRWAYAYFIRKNFYASPKTQEIAGLCATEAAVAMLDAHFPYDTDFAPWAHVIVINTCRKYMRKETQKSIVPDRELVDIDDPALAGSGRLSLDSQFALSYEISDAVGRLPESRRQLIELLYFEGLSPGEIAEKIGKSVSAVYSLHFNALAELRKILTKDSESK